MLATAALVLPARCSRRARARSARAASMVRARCRHASAAEGSAAVNPIDTDGRSYRISYQSLIPNIKIKTPAGGGDATRSTSRPAAPSRRSRARSRRSTSPGTKLKEATYTYWVDKDGAKQDKVSTLKIDFDQTAPQVYIESPANGKPFGRRHRGARRGAAGLDREGRGRRDSRSTSKRRFAAKVPAADRGARRSRSGSRTPARHALLPATRRRQVAQAHASRRATCSLSRDLCSRCALRLSCTARGVRHRRTERRRTATAGAVLQAAMFFNRDVDRRRRCVERQRIAVAALRAAGGWGNGDGSRSTSRSTCSPPTRRRRCGRSRRPRSSSSPDCDQSRCRCPTAATSRARPATRARDGDCHLLVFDDDAGKLYEMWRANITAHVRRRLPRGVEHAQALHRHAARRSVHERGRRGLPDRAAAVHRRRGRSRRTSITRSASSCRTIGSRRATCARRRTRTNTTGGTNAPPYGVHLRLRADYPIDSLPSEGAKVVARALQKYGMYHADGGKHRADRAERPPHDREVGRAARLAATRALKRRGLRGDRPRRDDPADVRLRRASVIDALVCAVRWLATGLVVGDRVVAWSRRSCVLDSRRRCRRRTSAGGFTTCALFRDGSRLATGSPVMIAGVRVGEVSAPGDRRRPRARRHEAARRHRDPDRLVDHQEGGVAVRRQLHRDHPDRGEEGARTVRLLRSGRAA